MDFFLESHWGESEGSMCCARNDADVWKKWEINFKLWTDWKGWVSKACLFSKMSIHDITVDWWEWTFDVHICTDVFYFHFWCRRPMHLLLAIPSCSLCYQIPLKSCQQVFFQDVTKHHSWWAFWSDISVKYGGILNFQFSQFNQPINQPTNQPSRRRNQPINWPINQETDLVIHYNPEFRNIFITRISPP